MPSFRTSSLFHYTNKIENIQSILKNGLIPNYCSEDLRFTYKKGLYIGIPMVSFCDIPISKANIHAKRYGDFAIGLNKDCFKKKSINPIMYAYNNQILKSIYNIHNGIVQYWERNHQILMNAQKANAEYFSKTKKIDKKRLSPAMLEFRKDIKILCKELIKNTETRDDLIGYIKKYEGKYKKKKINNYEENEWRYVVERDIEIPWHWSEEDYAKWRLSEENYTTWKLSGKKYDDWEMDFVGDKGKKPPPTDELKDKALKFKIRDISWIIVPNNNDVYEMVQYIKTLETVLGGNSVTLTEYDKAVLCSKIISLDKIETDL